MCTHIRLVTFLFLVLSDMPASDHYRMKESKTVLDYIPWIPDSKYWIPVFVSGPWISGSNRLWYSRFLVPYFNSKESVVFTRDSGFQRPNFPALRIPRAKISWISKRNPDSLTSGEQLCHDFLLL